MTAVDKTKEVFDTGIVMTEKAAERLTAVMKAEGKKGLALEWKLLQVVVLD